MNPGDAAAPREMPGSRPLRVFVSAGEASGDDILGAVLADLRARRPDLESAGLGGPAAEACGLKPMFPLSRTAFSGAWDVVANAAFALRMYRAAVRELDRFRPHLAILVDYPGLNLRLAREARRRGIPVHFIAPPQAWAYRDPARKLRRARNALHGCSVQALFPFEAPYWKGGAADVNVGHFHATVPKVLPKSDLLCLCPGSRGPVLRRNLPVWLRLLRESGIPASVPIALLAPEYLAAEAAALARSHAPERSGFLTVRTDRTDRTGSAGSAGKWAAMAEASRAIAFPGTVTLELARWKVPTLVLALLDPFTYAVGKRLLHGRTLSLPSLLLGEAHSPEWVGTAPGPDAPLFRKLFQAVGDARKPDAERDGRLVRLEERIGAGNGAEVATRACLKLLANQVSQPLSGVESPNPLSGVVIPVT